MIWFGAILKSIHPSHGNLMCAPERGTRGRNVVHIFDGKLEHVAHAIRKMILFGGKNTQFVLLSIQTNAFNRSNNRDCSLLAQLSNICSMVWSMTQTLFSFHREELDKPVLNCQVIVMQTVCTYIGVSTKIVQYI